MFESFVSHPKLPRICAKAIVRIASRSFPQWAARAWSCASGDNRAAVELSWLHPRARLSACLHATVGLAIQSWGPPAQTAYCEIFLFRRSHLFNNAFAFSSSSEFFEFFDERVVLAKLLSFDSSHSNNTSAHTHKPSTSSCTSCEPTSCNPSKAAYQDIRRAIPRRPPFSQWRNGFPKELCQQLSRALPPQQAAQAALLCLWPVPQSSSDALAYVRQTFGDQATDQACASLAPLLLQRARLRGLSLAASTVEAGSNQRSEFALSSSRANQNISRAEFGSWFIDPLFSLMKSKGVDVDPLAADFISRHDASMAQTFQVAFASKPCAWDLATANDYHAILGASFWGLDVDLPGPDGKRPIDIAVKSGRRLLFRSLILAGADATTKAAGSRKPPIELGKHLLRDDLTPSLLAKAERSMIDASLTPHHPTHTIPAPTQTLDLAQEVKPKPRRL